MNIKKRTIVIIFSGVFTLLIGIGIGFELGKKVSLLPSPSAPSENNIAKEVSGNNQSFVGEFEVTRVVDGDTIEIEGGERVRYIGIDTPETVDPRKPVQCFGVEASNKNKELVGGKTVRLEKDTTDRDKYKRLLRYVYAGDTFINLELVRQGFAYSYSYPPDIKYQEQIVAAQKEAENSKNGLWIACPLGKSQPVATSQEATAKENTSGDCTIKGNISTTGEKIYHLVGCGSYAKTTIEESRGEQWFCSEAEAQAAGWRKALNC
jgi:micrococcal nuclease